MLSEIIKNDIKEVQDSEMPSYRDIKPESSMSVNDAKKYWDGVFIEEPKQYFDDNGKKYRQGDMLEVNNKFEVNGYSYETDSKSRVISVEGELQVKNHKGRNEMPDSRDTVAHGEMKPTDDRGHLIADRFNGSGELENLVPMEGKLNKGDYAKLENTLAEAMNDGADVRLKVEVIYEGDSTRPTEFRMSYSIDGEKDTIIFKNRSDY